MEKPMKYMTQVEIVKIIEKVATARGIQIGQRSPQSPAGNWTYQFGPNKNSVRISYWLAGFNHVDEDILILTEPLPQDSFADFELRLNSAINKLIDSEAAG